MPHSGHCARLQGQSSAINKPVRLRQTVPMPADPPASGPTVSQFGIATELRWSLARPPKPPESQIGYAAAFPVRCSALRSPGASLSVSLMDTNGPVSSTSAFTALCPCGSLRGAPGGFARLFVSGLPTSPLSSLGVPRAVPHAGHSTRLQGHAYSAGGLAGAARSGALW